MHFHFQLATLAVMALLSPSPVSAKPDDNDQKSSELVATSENACFEGFLNWLSAQAQRGHERSQRVKDTVLHKLGELPVGSADAQVDYYYLGSIDDIIDSETATNSAYASMIKAYLKADDGVFDKAQQQADDAAKKMIDDVNSHTGETTKQAKDGAAPADAPAA